MTLADIQRYCLAKKNVTAEYLHEGILTFKLRNKVFCYCYTQSDPLKIILKCDLTMAKSLRAQFSEIKEGFKMNTNAWNTVTLSPRITSYLLEEMIDHSYELIEDSFPVITDAPVYRAPVVKRQEVLVAVN